MTKIKTNVRDVIIHHFQDILPSEPLKQKKNDYPILNTYNNNMVWKIHLN